MAKKKHAFAIYITEDEIEDVRNRSFWMDQPISHWVRDLVKKAIQEDVERLFGKGGKFPRRIRTLTRGFQRKRVAPIEKLIDWKGGG